MYLCYHSTSKRLKNLIIKNVLCRPEISKKNHFVHKILYEKATLYDNYFKNM